MGDNGTAVPHWVSKENSAKGYEMHGQSSKGVACIYKVNS